MARHGSNHALERRERNLAPSVTVGPALESSGNSYVFGCLQTAIANSHVPHKVLADELGISEGYWSKLRNGQAPFPVQLLDRLRPEIRAEWRDRLEEHEDDEDGLVATAEQLIVVAVRFMKLYGAAQEKRMAKAQL